MTDGGAERKDKILPLSVRDAPVHLVSVRLLTRESESVCDMVHIQTASAEFEV